jgi:hypothetical protein
VPKVWDLLSSPDLREVAGREPGRASEVGERYLSDRGQDLVGEEFGICDRVRMRAVPVAQFAPPASHRRASLVARRTSVRRVDALGALLGDGGAPGLGEGFVEVHAGSAADSRRSKQDRWLTDMQMKAPAWKPGDRIQRGRDTLEVVDVRDTAERVTLVVKPV